MYLGNCDIFMVIKNYPDFVAKTQQVNSPPGSYDTIKEWIREGFITAQSNVLEIGCTMGFNSYHIRRYTGAEVTGVDLSSESVKKATQLCGCTGVKFLEADGKKLPFSDSSFTHVVIGGHLPWVSRAERVSHISEALRVLKPGGMILTSLYYFKNPPKKALVEKFNKAFNTQLDVDADYDYWSSLFDREELFCENENNYEIILPDDERTQQYLGAMSGESRKQWEKKVDLFIENGSYLNFFVKVLHKVDNLHYRQKPKGGIYTWKRS